MLPSSRVNDGVCDCCDGTDEHDGRTNCANTCVQAGAARRDAIRTKVHAAKGGVDRGRKIRDAAPALRRKWMDESATLEKDVAAQRAIVHDANVAKDVAEREESDATKAEDRLNKREAARNSSSSSTADEFTRRERRIGPTRVAHAPGGTRDGRRPGVPRGRLRGGPDAR